MPDGPAILLNWYIWTVRPSKINIINKFIEENVPEVKQVVCPTVTVSKTSKTGKVKKRELPIYSEYLFLQYDDHPTAYHKLIVHPFISKFLGPCKENELKIIESLQKPQRDGI